MSDSLRPHRLLPARLLCPWASPGKNTWVGCLSPLQGIFWPRNQTFISYIGWQIFTTEPPGKPCMRLAFLKVRKRPELVLSPPCEDTRRKAPTCKPRRRPSRILPCQHPNLGLLKGPELWEINVCGFNHLVYSIFLQQLK